MTRAAACLAALGLALVAGCGGGDGDGGAEGPIAGGGGGGSTRQAAQPGGAAAAQAFMGCFRVRGYRAVDPKKGEESFFAFEADRKGFPNAPVNVTRGKGYVPSAFMIFFADEGKAKEALDQVGRRTVGDIPPQQRGPAVIAYTDREERAEIESAVNGCV